MSNTTPKFLLLVALAVGMPACGGDAAKKTDAKTDANAKKTEGDAKKPEDAKPAPAANAFKKVAPLPLEIEVPTDATVSDASGDAPGADVMAADGSWVINIRTTTEAYASDMAGAKKDIEMGGKVKAYSKEAAIDGGGWHLEWEATSITGNNVYGVEIRKVIDGKNYQCSRNDPSQAVRDTIAKACLTLKKAG